MYLHRIIYYLNRGRKHLEGQGIDDDEKIGNLEKQFIEAQQIADEADKRYDEVNFDTLILFIFCIKYIIIVIL